MFHRSQKLALLSLFLFDTLLHPVYAEDDFDCHITVNDAKFDLTALAGEQVINRTRSTPPTTMIDSLRFDLCANLKPNEALSEHDQCSTDTRVCLTKVNQKENEPDRVTAVIPIAQTTNLNLLSAVSQNPKSLSLQLHGATYSGYINPQMMNLTVICDPDQTLKPEFVSYDGQILHAVWHAPAGCAFHEPPPDGDKKEDNPPTGSGMGWFFLVILLALLAYFCLGAYYNYSTYGASGADLIPHRDFWREVPYMLTDVVSHICWSARPRKASRGGYVAV